METYIGQKLFVKIPLNQNFGKAKMWKYIFETIHANSMLKFFLQTVLWITL